MADRDIQIGPVPGGEPIIGKAVDNGDGTFSVLVAAQLVDGGVVNTWVPNGAQADQALTVDATAGGVQFAAFHADTAQVFWDCQAAQCRVTFDGSAPTASNGHLIEPGDSGVWPKALAAGAKFICTGAASGLIHASQLKGA